MNKYTVRLEFDVKSSDLAEVNVEATSRKEAIEAAIQKYHDGESLDYYASDYMETSLADNSAEWIVKEK